MSGKKKEVRSSFLIALAAAASFAVGCAQLPSQPLIEPETSEVTVTHDGLVSGVTDLLKGLIVRTLNLVGSLGGTLTNGRWKVVIPAGAVDGSAQVGLGVLTSISPSCQLEIYPADKNRFKVPVTLTIDCRSVPLSELKTYTIFWYNPTTRIWEPVAGSKVDLVNKTVSAPLSHFSKYAAGPVGGKAGW
jgi:hypothetical protein